MYLFAYGNSVIFVINSPRKIKAPIIDISARSKCILETRDMEKLGLSPKVHDGMHQNNSYNLQHMSHKIWSLCLYLYAELLSADSHYIFSHKYGENQEK